MDSAALGCLESALETIAEEGEECITELKVSELMKLGKLLGVTDFEKALDAENPLIETRTLVLLAYRQLVEQQEKAEAEKSALRETKAEELKQAPMRELRDQAKTIGLTTEQMDEIEDDENPKGKLIRFIIEAEEKGIPDRLVEVDTEGVENPNGHTQETETLFSELGNKIIDAFDAYENLRMDNVVDITILEVVGPVPLPPDMKTTVKDKVRSVVIGTTNACMVFLLPSWGEESRKAVNVFGPLKTQVVRVSKLGAARRAVTSAIAKDMKCVSFQLGKSFKIQTPKDAVLETHPPFTPMAILNTLPDWTRVNISGVVYEIRDEEVVLRVDDEVLTLRFREEMPTLAEGNYCTAMYVSVSTKYENVVADELSVVRITLGRKDANPSPSKLRRVFS